MNLIIKAKADSEADMAKCLRDLAEHVEEGDATSGGFGANTTYGYGYKVLTDAEMEQFKLRTTVQPAAVHPETARD